MCSISLLTETHSHQGRSFLLGFLEMETDQGSSAIYVTCSKPSEIRLTVPFLNQTFTKHSVPGISTKFDLSSTVRMRGIGVEKKGILLTANTTISVYATNINNVKKGRDVYVIFPTPTLGTQYVVTTYTPMTKSLAGIIALRDNTLVQIKLRIQGDVSYMGKAYRNGDILRIFLNRLETFQLQHTKDLTGTFVVSTGPVVVLGGNVWAKVPVQKQGMSHLCTQLLPVSKWGTRFMASPIVGRTVPIIKGGYFKIVAAFNNTAITIQGKANLTLNAGQNHHFSLGQNEARYINSGKPVMVMQYNQGSSGRVASDPFALMVPPIEQYTNSYNLPIPIRNIAIYTNHISFIASELKSIVFDASKFCKESLTQLSIPGTNFTMYSCKLKKIGATKVIPISHTSQDGRIVAYMVGHSDRNAYGYLGGMEMKNVNCLRLFQDGMTMDSGCDDGIDNNVPNITSCDPELSLSQIPLSSSEYLNGCDVSLDLSRTTQNCEAIVARVYSFGNGTRTIVAKQQIRWQKPRPTITFVTPTDVNESGIPSLATDVRDMSSLCPGDSLKYNYTSSVSENGVKTIQILWTVREACGRVTTAKQRISGKIR